MKTIICIRHPKRSGLKHIPLDPVKHTVLAGYLCRKPDLKQLGLIVRVYSE